jgi:hypothetical protein
MTTDTMLLVITTLGWLVLTCSAVASYRFGWSKFVKFALVWMAIFAGVTMIVAALQPADSTSASLI